VIAQHDDRQQRDQQRIDNRTLNVGAMPANSAAANRNPSTGPIFVFGRAPFFLFPFL
jgi:hypothetical protein